MSETTLDVEPKVDSSTTANNEPEVVIDQSQVTPVVPEMSEGEARRARYLSREGAKTTALLEKKQKRIDELEAAQTSNAIKEIPFPKEEDFETQEEFHKAHSDYTVSVVERKNADAESSRTANEAAKRHAEAVKPFFETVERLDPVQQEKVLKAERELGNEDGSSKLDDQTQRFILSTPDVGPQLLVHLHEHPQVLKELNSLDEFTRPLKLNELRQNLIKAVSAKTKTGAPEPASTLDSLGSQIGKNPDEMTMTEWKAWKAAERKAGRY